MQGNKTVVPFFDCGCKDFNSSQKRPETEKGIATEKPSSQSLPDRVAVLFDESIYWPFKPVIHDSPLFLHINKPFISRSYNNLCVWHQSC